MLISIICWIPDRSSKVKTVRQMKLHTVLAAWYTHVMIKWQYALRIRSIHYSDVKMSTMASQITRLTIFYSGPDQWKHQSSASLALVILGHMVAWRLTAPRHYLNQGLLLISEVLWHSFESNFTTNVQSPILHNEFEHYIDVIMTTIASQITTLTMVYSIVYSGADQRKHQSSASLAFERGIHRDRWIPRTKRQ